MQLPPLAVFARVLDLESTVCDSSRQMCQKPQDDGVLGSALFSVPQDRFEHGGQVPVANGDRQQNGATRLHFCDGELQDALLLGPGKQAGAGRRHARHDGVCGVRPQDQQLAREDCDEHPGRRDGGKPAHLHHDSVRGAQTIFTSI